MLGWVILKYHSSDNENKFKLMVDCFKDEFRLDQCSELSFQVLVNVYFNHPGTNILLELFISFIYLS